MTRSKSELWSRFQHYYREFPSIQLAIDISRMNFPDDFLEKMKPGIQKAFVAMAKLEKGEIANPDENRMVGHYWLRNPSLAPTPAIREEIETTIENVKRFASDVHAGTIRGATGPFKNLLLIGIGGSALGPQFVSDALRRPGKEKLSIFFFDNTDPDGMEKVLADIGPQQFGQTLCVIISKSGGTKETRNGMLVAEAAYRKAGLAFAQHAVAVTGALSQLDRLATEHKWLRRFPMWDWVGGRTSETSAVGLLPAALQGFDITALLAGARACDDVTRTTDTLQNPAAQLALMWYYIGGGRGSKDMVVLPYKDRLLLFSRYLQQLVMESLGKEKDLNGNVVHQGIAVYGNKGSTDQHAYIQQLRDGILNFFVVFIEVHDRTPESLFVEDRVTSGDYLEGFFLGTREALYENGRESITLTLQDVNAFMVGVLIALFERAVGFYATLVNINAYHQPGVEAGKKAAESVIQLQQRILPYLEEKRGHALTAAQIASGIGAHDAFETVFKVCEHLAASGTHKLQKKAAKNAFESTYAVA